MNSRAPIYRFAAALSAAASLTACGLEGISPGTASATPREVATVTAVIGSNAHIRRASGAEPAVAIGTKLFDGDRFWTGAASELEMNTIHGQTIRIYENSDPILQEAACFTISFFTSGKIRIDGSHVCVNGQYQQASVVGYEVVGPDAMRIWVDQGQVRALRNPAIVINANQGAVVQSGIVLRGPITPHNSQQFEQKFPRPVQIL